MCEYVFTPATAVISTLCASNRPDGVGLDNGYTLAFHVMLNCYSQWIYYFWWATFISKVEIELEYEIDDLIVTFTRIPENLKVLIDGLYHEITAGDGWSIQFDEEGVHSLFFSGNTKHLESYVEIEIV